MSGSDDWGDDKTGFSDKIRGDIIASLGRDLEVMAEKLAEAERQGVEWQNQIREVEARNDALHDQLSDLNAGAVATERQRDALREANHGVAVCAQHTGDVIGDGCLVCERDALREALSSIEEASGRDDGPETYEIWRTATAALARAAQQEEGT